MNTYLPQDKHPSYKIATLGAAAVPLLPVTTLCAKSVLGAKRKHTLNICIYSQEFIVRITEMLKV